MNRGLVDKAVRELWPATVLCGLLVCAFETVIAVVLPRYENRMGLQMLEMPFVKRVIEGMLGSRLSDQIGPEILWSIPWAHPVMMSLVLAHAVIAGTRLPAGEVDRGTIDVALGLPVSRWRWMWTDSVVWVVSAALMILMAVVGNRAGSAIMDSGFAPDARVTAMIYLNLLGVYLAVGSGAWLISSLSDRRGKAMTLVFVLIVMSFLVSYLEQFWEPARFVAWVSVLSYHRPLVVLRDSAWPVMDLCVLYGVAGLLWMGAAGVFVRRDLCTT